jgi:hypothetical protein
MSRFTRIVLLAAALAAAYPLTGYSADTTDPLLGRWQLNLAKSTFSPGPGPKGQLRTYSHAGDAEQLAAKGIDPNGKPTLVRYTARYDGKDYAITGSSGGDQISLKRIDELTTESTQKRDGEPVIITTRTVSADGKTLTVTTKGTNAGGETMNHRMVFDKH